MPGTSSETTRDNLSIEAANLVKAYSRSNIKAKLIWESVNTHGNKQKQKKKQAYVDCWNGNYSQGENGTNGLHNSMPTCSQTSDNNKRAFHL